MKPFLPLQDLKKELDDHKPTLESAQDLCAWLSDKNKDEPLIVANIKDKLDKVESPYDDVRAKLVEMEGKLQAAQMRTQEFQVSFDEFKDSLGDMEEMAANQEPVSAVCDTVKEQQRNDEVSCSEPAVMAT